MSEKTKVRAKSVSVPARAVVPPATPLAPPAGPPPNQGKTPAQLLAEWTARDSAEAGPPGGTPPAGPPGAPPAGPEAPPAPGVADKVLSMLRGIEPIRGIVDALTANATRANQALQGQPLPPPAQGVNAPPGLDPTVQLLRQGTSPRVDAATQQ